MITRLINDMVDQGVLARSGKQYILLNRADQTISAINRREDRASVARTSSTSRGRVAKLPAQGVRPNGGITGSPLGRAPSGALIGAVRSDARGHALKS
jgi:hypothetical protein